jgi:hypothetical protein
MDPVSHLAFGRTLVALDGRRALGSGAIAACVFGSLTPDVDAVLMSTCGITREARTRCWDRSHVQRSRPRRSGSR